MHAQCTSLSAFFNYSSQVLEWEGLSCGAMRCGAGGNSVGVIDVIQCKRQRNFLAVLAVSISSLV